MKSHFDGIHAHLCVRCRFLKKKYQSTNTCLRVQEVHLKMDSPEYEDLSGRISDVESRFEDFASLVKEQLSELFSQSQAASEMLEKISSSLEELDSEWEQDDEEPLEEPYTEDEEEVVDVPPLSEYGQEYVDPDVDVESRWEQEQEGVNHG